MAYRYRLTLPKHVVLNRHKKAIGFLCFTLFCVLAGYLIFIWYISKEPVSQQPQSEIRSASYNPLQTFTTSYFSFEADNYWSFIEKESSKNVFVYRSAKNNIVSRDLTVYVNTLPQNLLLTRVLPLEASGNSFVLDEGVSDHCNTYLKDKIKPGNNNPIEGVVESVSIKCQVDGTSTTVGTGQKNGSYQIELKGESGDNKYFLLYHDLEFSPRLNIFSEIIGSFKAL